MKVEKHTSPQQASRAPWAFSEPKPRITPPRAVDEDDGGATLLRRYRPGDLVAGLDRKDFTHLGIARTPNRLCLETDPRRTRGKSRGQSKGGGFAGRNTAQRGVAPVVPRHRYVHVERGAILELGSGLVRGRDVAGITAVTGSSQDHEKRGQPG